MTTSRSQESALAEQFGLDILRLGSSSLAFDKLLNRGSASSELEPEQTTGLGKSRKKRTSGYYAAASKRTRKKRKEELKSLTLSNFHLEKEQPILKHKISSLTAELELFHQRSKNLLLSTNNKNLKASNYRLKKELLVYRNLSTQVKKFVQTFNQMEAISPVLSAFDRNMNFLLNHLLSLALSTSKKPITDLKPSVASPDRFHQKLFNSFVRNFLGDDADLIPDEETQGKHWFDLSSCSWETILEDDTDQGLQICRFDFHDIPVPKNFIANFWKLHDSRKFVQKMISDIQEETKSPKQINKDPIYGLMKLEISDVMPDTSDNSSEWSFRDIDCRNKPETKPSSKIYKYSLKSDEIRDPELFFLSGQDSTLVEDNYFPFSSANTTSEANLHIHSLLPTLDTDVEQFSHGGLTLFRGCIAREGTTKNSSDVSIFFKIKNGTVQRNSAMEKFDLKNLFSSYTSPAILARKMELLIQCCIFSFNYSASKVTKSR